VIEKLLQFPR